jgi:flagellar motility protein MotE (MotC chaperone)
MKKVIILCEILVVVFIAVKLVTVSGMLKNLDPSGGSWFPGLALADPASKSAQPAQSQDMEDQLTNERKLLASLTERQQQLDSRENNLKAEEKRLEGLKREIIQKIDHLRGQEEKLKTAVEVSITADDKKFKDLARVYEAAPAQQVGTILEKMDTKTAAGILMNMNSKKAGAIWGYINTARSVEIAKEITSSQAPGGGAK